MSLTVSRQRFTTILALGLLVPFAAFAIASGTTDAQGPWSQEEAEVPQADDWSTEARVLPGEGFSVETTGTVDGQPASLERTFNLDQAELTIRYVLGDENDPDRSVEAHIQLLGIYTFEDTNSDDRFGWEDRIIDQDQVDPSAAYVTPVRSPQPFDSVRVIVPLEDSGHISLTLTSPDRLAVFEGSQLAPTDAWMNLTASDVPLEGNAQLGLSARMEAPSFAEAEDGLVRLEGLGSGIALDKVKTSSQGVSTAPGGVSLFETHAAGDDRSQAAVVFASPGSSLASHGSKLSAVHTSTGLGEAAGGVQGQAGAFVLGLAGATLLVATSAWRKLKATG